MTATERTRTAEAVAREARPVDVDAVASFTRDTWSDGDYVHRVFEEWVATDGPEQRTFVATLPAAALEGDVDETLLVEGDGSGAAAAGESEAVVGCVQAVLLSEWEAWAQGIRVHPEYRGLGAGNRLSGAAFRWARGAGAAVCRNMVFSWNLAGLGQSRATGFDPCVEFRWVHPAPDADADPAAAAEAAAAPPGSGPRSAPSVRVAGGAAADDAASPADAWSFWTDSDAAAALSGLALDDEEAWALSRLTRERVRRAAEDGRLLTVDADGTAATALRNRTYEREDDDGTERTWAEYAVGAWADPPACGALLAAVARDAAAAGADRTRVLVPEGGRWVSDASLARAEIADEPTFVLAADLTAVVD